MDNVQQSQEQEKPIYTDLASASDALLSRWEDASEPSEQATEEATATADEETEELEQEQEIQEEVELDDDDEEIDPDELQDTEEEEAEEEVVEELSDDTLVELTIDGESKQASIKDLKRLYGQEASLTRKSQEVAAQRKQAEDNIGKTSAILQRLVEQAEQRYKPYSEVDMLLASKSMEDADFAQLRKEAQEAADNLKFVKEEADAFYKDIQTQQQQQLQEAASNAVKVLQEQIPDWSNSLYDDIRAYAVGQGLAQAEVDNYVDPVVISILNKARLYDQAKQVTTTKKKRVAKKVLKSKKAPANDAQIKAKRMRDAKARLQERGNDIDDIADILLQRWEA